MQVSGSTERLGGYGELARAVVGLVFLLASAIGTAMAAFFDIRQPLHAVASMIGIPSLPIAAMLISASLVRNPAWSSGRRLLLGTANLTWISVVLMLVVLFIGLSQTGGQFGPGVPVGWPNRLVIATDCAWLLAVAWYANRQRAQAISV